MEEIKIDKIYTNEDGVTVFEVSEDCIDKSKALTWDEQIAYRDYMRDLQIDITGDDD